MKIAYRIYPDFEEMIDNDLMKQFLLTFCIAMACIGLLETVLPVASAEPLTLSPAPIAEGQGINTDPVQQKPDAMPLPPHDARLQIQLQEGTPRALMFRQLQAQPYKRYEAKTRPLQKTLNAFLAYLDSLRNQPPSLQRLNAFRAEAALDFSVLKATLTPKEQEFHSFQLIREAMSNLDALSADWQKADRLDRLTPPTRLEVQEREAMLQASRTKIHNVLRELEQFEALKQSLSRELP